MKTTTELIQLLNNRIENLSLPAQPQNLYDPIHYIISNAGKRLRPVLFLQAIQLFSEIEKSHIMAAIGLEVFHNFTLIHDDIMDKADVRRNQPTIHKKWNQNIALLSGDATMILAYQLIQKLPENILKSVMEEFNTMAMEICEGQQYDMDFEHRANVSVDEYLKMIRLKTAVFLAHALKMGAMVGGSTPEEQNHMYQAGLNFGIAFQLQDDFLDTFGNLKTFGKKTGGDILEKKKTFLLITTLEKADPVKKESLLNTLHNKLISNEEKIETVKNIYYYFQIDKATLSLIDKYYSEGMENLKNIQGHHKTKNQLIDLFSSLRKRVS